MHNITKKNRNKPFYILYTENQAGEENRARKPSSEKKKGGEKKYQPLAVLKNVFTDGQRSSQGGIFARKKRVANRRTSPVSRGASDTSLAVRWEVIPVFGDIVGASRIRLPKSQFSYLNEKYATEEKKKEK